MSIAPLLLAFLSVAGAPPHESNSGAVLLNFHAQWCGPCQKVRPAVEQLIRDGYPIKRIDIDEEPDLPRRYRVDGVPAFIVVDRDGRELGRLSGPRSAKELARFYRTAAAKAELPDERPARGAAGGRRRSAEEDDDEDQRSAEIDARRGAPARDGEDEAESSEPAFTNPSPWETVVRIRVIGPRSTGFGSGTVIYSTPEESLILTCAHIFKLDGRRTPAAAQFPRRIVIDRFDGRLQGTKPAQVHFVESFEGKAVDYDFSLDVGLIRMRPGRQLPSSRVVPTSFDLKSRTKVVAVGCPEGQDATVWHTVVRRPRIQNFLSGQPNYEAIECDVAPKEGRSGGGLYTLDGYVVGVCNFAEPQGDHGLYATPRSIYTILNRNSLASLYAPVSRDSANLVADRRPAAGPRRTRPVSVARSQSPDAEEPDRSRGRAERGDVLIPPPSFMGIADPVVTRSERKPVAASGTTRRASWQAAPDPSAKAPRHAQAEPDDADQDETEAPGRFDRRSEDPRDKQQDVDKEEPANLYDRSVRGNTRWRAVKISQPDQALVHPEN